MSNETNNNNKIMKQTIISSLLEKNWHGFARFTVGGPVYCEVR